MGAKLILNKPSPDEMKELLAAHGTYIKLAVDVSLRRVAGGGEWHADAEALLLESGSRQSDIWGGDWLPASKEVEFDSMINVSTERNNPSREIQNEDIRRGFEEIVRNVFQDS